MKNPEIATGHTSVFRQPRQPPDLPVAAIRKPGALPGEQQPLPANYYLKRATDLIVSLVLLVLILSWLLPLLALLVWIDTGRPVFFVQKRIGRGNRCFYCIKFRTMSPPEAEGPQRISRLGHFLRNRKLDEIPQLFNVLRGEMSLVGPRPHMLADHERFGRTLGAEYHERHRVLPGITGLAQIRGYEGPVHSVQKLRGRVHLDLFYIRHWSPLLEWWIIVQTVRFLLRNQNRRRRFPS